MDTNFWHDIWARKQIGFHQPGGNALLPRHLKALDLPANDRVFVPLCGKSADIGWLLSQGHRVVGIELSKLAVEELFQELGVEPHIAPAGPLTHFSAPGLDVFVGDIFDLTAGALGPVDAVYDRAALVALPLDMRDRYGDQIVDLTGRAPQLLMCYEYDQTAMDGPPFSVGEAEVDRVYGRRYRVRLLERCRVAGGVRGLDPVDEAAWLLSPTAAA